MYRTIVVGTDGSATAERAVVKAAEVARLTGAKLYLVSVFSDAATALATASAGATLVCHEWPDAAVEDLTARIEATAERLRGQGIDVEARVQHGTAAATLVAAAQAVDADLLVVGDRGLKGIRGMLGSVPSRVTHRACTDVLVVQTS